MRRRVVVLVAEADVHQADHQAEHDIHDEPHPVDAYCTKSVRVNGKSMSNDESRPAVPGFLALLRLKRWQSVKKELSGDTC